MRLVDFIELDEAGRKDAARILRDALAHMPSAYGAAGEAEAEVATFFSDPDRFAIAALIDDGLAGWIGGIDSYSHGLELHPLVVDPAHQRRGIGRALVAALEARAAAMGKLVVHLGTDDDFGGTSLYRVDVFPDPLTAAAKVASTGQHALIFYQKLGYVVVGLIPDANGFGKPDILMAKRIASPSAR